MQKLLASRSIFDFPAKELRPLVVPPTFDCSFQIVLHVRWRLGIPTSAKQNDRGSKKRLKFCCQQAELLPSLGDTFSQRITCLSAWLLGGLLEAMCCRRAFLAFGAGRGPARLMKRRDQIVLPTDLPPEVPDDQVSSSQRTVGKQGCCISCCRCGPVAADTATI